MTPTRHSAAFVVARLAPLVLTLTALTLGCAEPPIDGAPQVLGDHRYEVEVSAPSSLRVGGEATLDVRIRPKGERKLSLEFPTRVDVEGNDVVGAPERLTKETATVLTEPAIDFAVPLRGLREGRTDLEGRLRVGVCTGDLCEPVELPFEATIQVGP